MSTLSEQSTVKRFPSLPTLSKESFRQHAVSSLPKFIGRRGISFSKYTAKPKLDTTCLIGFGPLKYDKLELPYFEHSVPAGFPSNVDDPIRRHLDLSQYLIRHPKSVYYFKVTGYSMINAGINHRDLLVVDTALKPRHRDVVIAVLNGEFKLKRLFLEGPIVKLLSANPDFPAITITKEMDFFVQGVATTVIRTFNPLPYDNHFKDITYTPL